MIVLSPGPQAPFFEIKYRRLGIYIPKLIIFAVSFKRRIAASGPGEKKEQKADEDRNAF